jgi:hypothetical protein
MNDMLFKNIITNPWIAILTLIIATGILHLLLVWPKNLTKRQWKKVDYYWILLTSLGIIGTTRVAEKTISQNDSYVVKYQLLFEADQLVSYLTPENSSWVCRTFTKTEFSPENIEEVQKEYDKACQWRNDVSKIVIKSIDTINFNLIEIKKLPILNANDSQIKVFKNDIFDHIKTYNNCVKILKKNSQIQEPTTGDIMIIYFSPILLIAGLSLRITKVTGELKYEKKNGV